jgi:hypothetical protein
VLLRHPKVASACGVTMNRKHSMRLNQHLSDAAARPDLEFEALEGLEIRYWHGNMRWFWYEISPWSFGTLPNFTDACREGASHTNTGSNIQQAFSDTR